MFTRLTKMQEVLECPGMDAVKKFISEYPVEGAPAEFGDVDAKNQAKLGQTFEEICSAVSPAWNPDAMADGLSAVAARAATGAQTVYEIYPEGELAADPGKQRTGLVYLPAAEKGPFALVVAGGAYIGVANIVEAFPVARRLNELGLTAFVLQYRAGTRRAAVNAGEDIRRAIRMIMERSGEFGVEQRYIAFGFSAGGHLVSELGTVNQGYLHYGFPKPELLGLAYPLVSLEGMDDGMAEFVMRQMLGDGYTDEARKAFEPISNVDSGYPRTFIMQTVEDEQVDYEKNGLAFYRKMQSIGVPCRLKEVAHGMHGLGLGKDSEAEGWVDEAVAFWRAGQSG